MLIYLKTVAIFKSIAISLRTSIKQTTFFLENKEDSFSMKINSLKVSFISIAFVYSYLVWQGFYGYGIDYYAVYHRENLDWGGMIQDKLGYAISSLSIYETHIGVLIVSLAVSLSLTFYLHYFFKDIGLIKNQLPYILIFIFLLHCWPVVMSNSNVMRQGLAMSFMMFALANFELNKKKLAWTQVLIMMTMHKSAVIFAFYFLSIEFLKTSYSKKINSSLRKLSVSTYFVITIISILYVIPVYFGKIEASRIIGYNLSPILLTINVAYLFFYIFILPKKEAKKTTSQFLLFNSLISPIFYFYNFNWEYERLNMIVFNLYILISCRIFIKRDKKIYTLLLICFSFFLATFFAGMFSALY